MGRHPLEGIRAKLDRASEDVATLQVEFQRFMNGKPLRVGFKFDAQTGWHTAYVEGGEPPIRLSVLVGEIVFHLRSALDHLVWALVKANHKKPGQHNTFPIRLKPYRRSFWETTKTSSLKGVRREAVALIERLQPYTAKNGLPREQFLAILDELARIDRHRTLHASFVGSYPAHLRPLFHPIGRARIADFRALPIRGRNLLVDGTNIARLRIEPYRRKPQVKVQGDLPALVAFGDRREVLPITGINDLYTNVRKALGLFEQFF